MNSYNYSTSMYIGETSQGIPMPVFFDLHTPIFNNKPPGVCITGKPGSGKSYLAMTLTAISAILGKTTIVLDPKGDFISLMNLQQDIGKFNLWNLSDKRRRGLLDPFRMSKDPGEQLDLAMTVIEMFTGGIDGEQRTALAPIIKDVIQGERPSLGKVVQELRGSNRQAARDLGTSLDLIASLPLAGLCFAPAGANLDSVSIDSGLTVITLLGMDMPAEGAKDNKSRLASGILFLLTDFIRRIMKNDETKNPKTLVIDEAWAVLQTPAGAQVVKEVALLGRSKNLAMLLVTQNNSHLEHLDIESTITTRFAFSSTGKDAESLIKDMKLPRGEGFEGLITSLSNGECLMQDFNERYSTVQISNWRKDWDLAFRTNPIDKARAERAKKEKEAAEQMQHR